MMKKLCNLVIMIIFLMVTVVYTSCCEPPPTNPYSFDYNTLKSTVAHAELVYWDESYEETIVYQFDEAELDIFLKDFSSITYHEKPYYGFPFSYTVKFQYNDGSIQYVSIYEGATIDANGYETDGRGAPKTDEDRKQFARLLMRYIEIDDSNLLYYANLDTSAGN